MSHPKNPNIADAVAPLIGAPAFTKLMSRESLVEFRNGQVAGTHAAEDLDTNLSLHAVMSGAAEASENYPISDEFALGAALAAYQIRKARA